MSTPAQAVQVTESAAVSTRPCAYRGLSVRDLSGSANVIRVYDGTTADGPILATFALAADGSALDNIEGGVWATTGLYFDADGDVEGSVRVG